MIKVNFYETVDDSLLKFAVIISKSQGKWVFCKHRERNTYEIPGGRREKNETILETAIRELKEDIFNQKIINYIFNKNIIIFFYLRFIMI